MWDCMVIINSCRGLVGLIGTMSIVAGAVKIDRDYDNHGIYSSAVGMLLFFGGWSLFAFSIGLLHNNLSSLVFDLKAALGIIGSLLTATAITLSQIALYQRNVKAMRVYFLLFTASWPVIAYAIALPSSVLGATNPLIKASLVGMGVVFIIWGKLFLMANRKRGAAFLLTGNLAPADAYSPGLPLYTAGWFFLAFANALL